MSDDQSGIKPVGPKQCFALPHHPNLQDSWGCCMCRTANGTHRTECKNCDHKRCDLNPNHQPS
jgi:hypothetical protein